MNLYLVQHGEAVSEEIDAQRPLSDKGRSDVRRVGKLLREAGLEVESIWHSGKLRAQQTAEILGEVLYVKGNVVAKKRLAPLDPTEPIENELRKREEDLMIVGHLPFLEKLVSRLLVNSDSPNLITFQQGGVVNLQRSEAGNWAIRWMIVPGLL